MTFFFCFVCNAGVTIFEELLLQLSQDEQDGSAPRAATLSCLGALQEVWVRMQHTPHPPLPPDLRVSWGMLPAASRRVRVCRDIPAICLGSTNRPVTALLFLPLSGTKKPKIPVVIPCDSHEECLESMGSVWGSFQPAVATKRIHSSALHTRLARK